MARGLGILQRITCTARNELYSIVLFIYCTLVTGPNIEKSGVINVKYAKIKTFNRLFLY